VSFDGNDGKKMRGSKKTTESVWVGSKNSGIVAEEIKKIVG